jgi:hypothetical protein
VLLGLSMIAAGCEDVFGPERPPTTSVRGRVLLAGRPLSRGWLEMLPAGGTLGNLRSAPIGPDGRFAASRVPVGRVAIRLVGSPPGRTGDPVVDAFLAELRRSHALAWSFPAHSTSPIVIDLAIEARKGGAIR